MEKASAPHGDRIAVPLLGIAQILSWGSSFYLLAVLAMPISTDTGWPLVWVVGGGSFGLLCSTGPASTTSRERSNSPHPT